MLGKVKQIGKNIKQTQNLKEGEWAIPLCSISAIPLSIHKIHSFHGDQVEVEGIAIVNATTLLVSPPKDSIKLIHFTS
jgi:hypothetical protein